MTIYLRAIYFHDENEAVLASTILEESTTGRRSLPSAAITAGGPGRGGGGREDAVTSEIMINPPDGEKQMTY